jgi:putative membrane protein
MEKVITRMAIVSKQEEILEQDGGTVPPNPDRLISKRVSDHLANERTFLAWIRTGLATITFGFVVERFGLLLRELGLKNTPVPIISEHYSTTFGVTLTLLGSILIIFALINFLRNRRAIDRQDFHPQAAFAIILTVLASLIGVILAVYLLLTA